MFRPPNIALLLILFSSVTLTTIAQVVVSIDEYNAAPGTVVEQYFLNDSTGSGIQVDVGMAGGPQGWVFIESAYPGGTREEFETVDPAATPFSSDFPTSDHAWFFGNDSIESYFFFDLTSSSLLALGRAQLFQSQEIVGVNVPPQELLSFPVAMGSSWSNNFASRVDIAPDVVAFDSTSSQSIVDAWGTMSKEAGAYECLRIREDVTHISALLVNGVPMLPDTDRYISYSWLAEDVGLLATVQSLEGETDPDFAFAEAVNFATSFQTSLEEIGGNIPQVFMLEQNYPNPFNPTTSIEFSLPSQGRGGVRSVTLKVYDLLGREVATLVDERLAPGSYTRQWDAGRRDGGISSGVYLYTLRTGSVSQTKRMILLR